MLNFDLHTPTRVVYGKGEENNIGALIKSYDAKKVLVHYGGKSAEKSGLLGRVYASLENAGLEHVSLGGVKPNPRLSLVHKGIELAKKENIDFVLAVGGGSVIDSSKAIAVGYYYDGDVWDLYENKIPPKAILPVATILTIPAAGSESSISSVITNEEKQMKIGYDFDLLRPVFSVVDPELFFTLPENQVANGVADILSHIFERYFTNTKNTDLSDGLAEATMRTVIKNARIVHENPNDYNAWFEIGFSGSFAHNNILGVGREQDWASHNIEHQLSALYDIAHGAGLAIVTPAWIKYVYKTNPGIFKQWAINVWGVDASRDDEYVIYEGIRRYEAFSKELGLPTRLSDLSIDDKDFERMARMATGAEWGKESELGGLQKLNTQDVVNIYNLAK
ncbi:MAG: iron-containing alcohol dehydrogenase [Clostridiales Family XIII bacterium]|jgi:alcohol dehydrogenase YqhD (iron-dependent ADH family)|nr:iron-containing alcohol dehydrogenase [Clostridiales Family XIII bacterium]